MQARTDDPVVIRRTLAGLFGTRNAHLIDATASAYSLLLQLIDDGFKVIDLHIGHANPVITIEYSEQCHRWHGVVTRKVTRGGKTLRCKAHIIKGVQIEWYDRSH